MSRLETHYFEKIVPELCKQFGYSSKMEAPKMQKITLNMGVGRSEKNELEKAVADLARISGQKPIVTKAKKSIATFKIREGMSIGCKVTLRRDRMYEFLDRLINIVIPRIRDFRGLSVKGLDGRGNYSFGIREIIVFPEIDYEKSELRGLDITLTTNACNNITGYALLKAFNFPLVGVL